MTEEDRIVCHRCGGDDRQHIGNCRVPIGPDDIVGLPGNTLTTPPIVWPAGRDAGRREDMGSGHLRVVLDSDNDVCVEVYDGSEFTSVEFCCPGAGGGKSSRTRMALIALMVAMEADNAVDPSWSWR